MNIWINDVHLQEIAKKALTKCENSIGVQLSTPVFFHGFTIENWIPFFSDSLVIRSICYPRFTTDSKTLMMKYVGWGGK